MDTRLSAATFRVLSNIPHTMPSFISPVTRRSFLRRGTAGLAGAALVGSFPHIVNAQAAKAIRIGIVGCGGRGSGALADSMNADPSVVLTAMGDIAADRLESSFKNISTAKPTQVKVEDKNKFVGLDAIDKVLATDIDIVILTTPPGFRPAHLHKAINAGKHVFCEKPLGVDAPAIRHALEAVKKAKEKNLAIQTGFCWRYNFAERATMKKLHEGAIGDIRSYYGTYLTNTPWVKPRQEGWTDLEWQLRNWMYFTWLSGDHLVEQAVHSVDKMSWLFKDEAPVKCTALGGRQQRVEAEYGHIYDHFGVMYEFSGGRRGFIFARQMSGCSNENNDYITGATGTCEISGFKPLHFIETSAGDRWQYEKNGGEGGTTAGIRNQMYVQEHIELIESIRAGKPVNMGEQLAHSSMLAIMGRMSAYTGKTIAWDDAIASNETWAPKEPLAWDMKLATPEVAIPGRYKLPA
jgi:myo-inositol 2-dehydrogenase/D-chiro-inositol 1-dehydrogenase